MLAKLAESPTIHRGRGGRSPGSIEKLPTETLRVTDDDVILALPLQPRTPDVAMWAPQLAEVRSCAPNR